MAYSKLKLVSQSYRITPSIFSIKMWSESEVLTPLMLHKEGINAILIETGKNKPFLYECSNTIFLQQLE
jgi:hypothetical protein